MIIGDFNCKEVRWEEWSMDRSDESWEGKLLRMAMKNSMAQWAEENIIFRGEDKPSRLDLIFMKEPSVRKQEAREIWPGLNGRKGKQMRHGKNTKGREINTQR